MPRRSAANILRRWKVERASVHKKRKNRPKSNKFSRGDTSKHPRAHTSKQMWVGGHTRRSGTKVKGYYRKNPHYRRKR